MRRLSFLLFAALLSGSVCGADQPHVGTLAQLHEIDSTERHVSFAITGTVTHVFRQPGGSFIVDDGTGYERFRQPRGTDAVAVGDRVELQGSCPIVRCFWDPIDVRTLTVKGRGNPVPGPRPIADERDCAARHLQVVTCTGVVEDVFLDETDPSWFHLQLGVREGSLFVSLPTDDALRPRTLVGATVSVTGISVYNLNGVRRFTGWRILIERPQDLKVVTAAQADPADAPRLPACDRMGPDQVLRLGRRGIRGTVFASWHGKQLLVREDHRANVIRVELADDEETPPIGAYVKAAGIVQTDLFRICLARARITVLDEAPPQPTSPDEPVRNGEDLYREVDGRLVFNGHLFGHRILLRGTVRNLPSEGTGGAALALDCGQHVFSVDTTACPDALNGITPGCTVGVTGICIPETENWSPSHPYPLVKGVLIAVGKEDDIRLIARPPWWTPGRLFVLLLTLLAGLAAIFVWNVLLRRSVRRREHELEDEIAVRIGTEFKVQERTRLAVELHDAVSQNLTGVALHLRTAQRFADGAPAALRDGLARATATLASCRDELRNCLWDLRNHALEAADMNEAIRQTLAPHLGDANAVIRFNVPRERLTDNTTHALLRIIRELAVNAVRHGHATDIKVAGSLEPGLLRFSVRDNGCGFDPAACPGTDEGHFGLQGIRERVENAAGDLSIESAPGRGTYVSVILHLPKESFS